MKKIIIVIVLLIISCNKSDLNLETGIKLYNEKKNVEAKEFLLKSTKTTNEIETTNDQKAYYYLGNVYMNLKEYDKAIESYTTIYHKYYANTYELNNLIYNIACAYSLLGETEYSKSYLLTNYYYGDRKIKRVETDNNLLNFRKSSNYLKYKEVLNSLDPGKSPKNRQELISYMLNQNYEYYPNSPSPSKFIFNENGTYEEYCNPASWKVGSWTIDDNKMELRIEQKYLVMPRELGERQLNRSIKDSDLWVNGTVIVEVYDNIEDVIKYDEIKLDVISLKPISDTVALFKTNEYGDFSNNKIIKYSIGEYSSLNK